MKLFSWIWLIGVIPFGLYSEAQSSTLRVPPNICTSRLRIETNARAPEGEIHALIVAGSYGWFNYRHQADACHAYHVLRQHGIPPDNIILMMNDDIANSPNNPYPGKLFNKPHGEDVYKGVKIDYSGKAVTADNFLNILKGNASGIVGGNGRVLKSKLNDRIFVFYSDHGGVGVLGFPGKSLTAKDLNETLHWMYQNDRYNQLVFYLEACYSGSMFDETLTADINAYAITAAHRNESSYATYCWVDTKLPCLGDEFSVSWMEDSDVKDINNETLEEQYWLVKNFTKKSHVMRYGDLYMAANPVAWFQGEERITEKRRHSTNENPSNQESWPAFDVELLSLYRLKESSNDPHEVEQIEQEIKRTQHDRRNIELIYTNLVDDLVENAVDRRHILEDYDPVKNLQCHDNVAKAFYSICVNWSKFDYALKYTNVLNNLCTRLSDAEQIIGAMKKTCSQFNHRFL